MASAGWVGGAICSHRDSRHLLRRLPRCRLPEKGRKKGLSVLVKFHPSGAVFECPTVRHLPFCPSTGLSCVILASFVPSQRCFRFWMNNAVDSSRGGFFSCLSRSGELFDPKKYIWLNGRAVWMLAEVRQPLPFALPLNMFRKMTSTL